VRQVLVVARRSRDVTPDDSAALNSGTGAAGWSGLTTGKRSDGDRSTGHSGTTAALTLALRGLGCNGAGRRETTMRVPAIGASSGSALDSTARHGALSLPALTRGALGPLADLATTRLGLALESRPRGLLFLRRHR